MTENSPVTARNELSSVFVYCTYIGESNLFIPLKKKSVETATANADRILLVSEKAVGAGCMLECTHAFKRAFLEL